ncbi:MAG: hypothetical protein AAF562_10385 [Pseudomonadota bacterium]
MHFKTLSDWMRAPGGGVIDTEPFGLQQQVVARQHKSTDLKRQKQYDELYQQYLVAKLAGKTHKRWISELGKTTRASHRPVHRRLIPIDDYFIVGGERLFLPGDPRASFAQTANCDCTVVFEPVAVRLPTVSEMIELESQKKPGSDGFRLLNSGVSYKQRAIDTLIPREIRKVRVQLISRGNSLGAGRVAPGTGPKIPKIKGNAAEVLFLNGAQIIEKRLVVLEDIGKPVEVTRNLSKRPSNADRQRVVVRAMTFASVDVLILGTNKLDPILFRRPQR